MSPSRVGKRDHHMWNVVKPLEPRLKRDPQGLTERTLAVRTLSDSCFVETGVGWWGNAFFCLRFSTFIPLITDDINQLSFLSRRRGTGFSVICIPLVTQIKAAHWETKERWLVRWLLRPAHWNVSLLYPRCETPLKVKSCVVFYRGVLLLTLLVLYKLKSKSPCCPVSSPFRCPWHHFVRWTVVLLVCNMRSKDLGGLQKWDRSSCVSLRNVAIQGWKTRSSHVKCSQTLGTEIETRSSRADRTNFGSEDIEWFLFCWHIKSLWGATTCPETPVLET